jgi:hypothetical protein
MLVWRYLREHCSPEQTKKASMHSTNAAFERYFKLELEDVKNIYAMTNRRKTGKGEIIKLDIEKIS